MKPRKNSAAARIRRQRSRIEREFQQGRHKNEVRKDLIKEGAIPPISASHFNNVVSEFEFETPSFTALPNDAPPADVASMVGQPVGQAPAGVEPSSPPTVPKTQSATKRYFDTPAADDRFDAELNGGVK